MSEYALALHCDSPDCQLDGVRIASYKRGIMAERERTLKAIEKWKSQGRDEHDLWAMNNFLTGEGAFLTK